MTDADWNFALIPLIRDLENTFNCESHLDLKSLTYTFSRKDRPDLLVDQEEIEKNMRGLGDANNPLIRLFRDWADGRTQKTAGQAKGCSTLASDILLSLSGESLDVNKDVDGNICVAYRCADVKDGIALVGMCGRATSFESACEDYLKQIRGKTLVFNAESPSRYEVKVLG